MSYVKVNVARSDDDATYKKKYIAGTLWLMAHQRLINHRFGNDAILSKTSL